MPKLTIVMGATASGKTHFIKENYEGTDACSLNVFDYQEAEYDKVKMGDGIPFGAQYRCLMYANLHLQEDVIARLTDGQDVVVEQTFYKAKRRIVFLDAIREKVPDVTVDVYVMCPSDEVWDGYIKERELSDGAAGIKSLKEEIEFPNPAEGMDAIYEVADGEVRLRMDEPAPEILEPARKEVREEMEKFFQKEKERTRRQELLESMKVRKFWHYCEVCGKKEYLTAGEAFDAGWDYPPNIGNFGLLGPRTCGSCTITDTLWFKVNHGNSLPIVIEGMLEEKELATWHRIKGEPESLLDEEPQV